MWVLYLTGLMLFSFADLVNTVSGHNNTLLVSIVSGPLNILGVFLLSARGCGQVASSVFVFSKLHFVHFGWKPTSLDSI